MIVNGLVRAAQQHGGLIGPLGSENHAGFHRYDLHELAVGGAPDDAQFMVLFELDAWGSGGYHDGPL